jgi:hypothetical protein
VTLLVSFPAPFAAASQGGPSSPGPVVLFSSPGVKTVTLTACNSGGCSSVTRQLTVVPPGPAIAGFSVTPPRAEIGATLLLEASATGQPVVAFSWLVLQGGALRAVFSGPNAAWSTAGAPPGIYTVRLMVSNAGGSAAADAAVLLVPEAPSRLFTVPGCRLVDTRAGTGLLHSGASPFVIAVGGHCGIPATARAVVAHLTVVQPSASGFLAVFPADYSHFLVSSVNFQAGATRGNTLILPLSTDGAARLAASLSLAAPGTAHLVVDTVGYFRPEASPVVPLAFAARLCAFGFCELAAGTRVFFTEAFSSGSPALYQYDWLGTGAFDPPVAAPITSHVYAAPGFYFPAVRIASAGSPATLQAAAPIFINPADPAQLPAVPAGVTAVFAGFATFSTIDPTLAGTFPAYRLSVSNTPSSLLGYNVYVSKNGGPYRLVAALLPGLPAGEPVPVDAFTPPADSERLMVTAVNFAGEGAASAPVALSHP